CCIPFISLLIFYLSFFFNDTATTDIYTLSLHDALPICQAENNRGDGSLHPHAVHYSTTCVTTPEPTVLPPSRMAKWPPGSSATGLSRLTVTVALSPGSTISVPPASANSPVTFVVRKKNCGL